jgi:hypothetical protein
MVGAGFCSSVFGWACGARGCDDAAVCRVVLFERLACRGASDAIGVGAVIAVFGFVGAPVVAPGAPAGASFVAD